MATIDDVKKVLSGLENGSDLVQAVDSVILYERDLGKTKAREAKSKLQSALDVISSKLGIDPDSGDLDSLLSPISELVEKGRNADKTIPKKEQELESVRSEIAEIKALYKAEKEQREKAETLSRNGKIKEKLLKEMGDKIHAAGVHADFIIQNDMATLSESGEVYFRNGDDLVTFEDGISKYYESNKSDLKSTQSPGPGNKPESGKPKSFQRIQRSQFDSMGENERTNVMKTIREGSAELVD